MKATNIRLPMPGTPVRFRRGAVMGIRCSLKLPLPGRPPPPSPIEYRQPPPLLLDLRGKTVAITFSLAAQTWCILRLVIPPTMLITELTRSFFVN